MIGLPRGVRNPCFATSRARIRGGADLDEPREDPADVRRLLLVDHELPVLDPVAIGRIAAHPDALHAAGPELVADALGRHLALELGEGEQDVERQPAHGGGGVEALGDRDEGDARCGRRPRPAWRSPSASATGGRSCRPPRRRPGRPRCREEAAVRAGRSSVPPEMPPSS